MIEKENKRLRILVLLSGRGSNLKALIKACEDDSFPAVIVGVIADNPKAGGLQIADQAGIENKVVGSFEQNIQGGYALNKACKAFAPDYILLAGYMRLLSKEFVTQWYNRLLNIHPSLLPDFRGLNTHERALEAALKGKVEQHGCSVHMVRHEMDTGPILMQAKIDISADDDAVSLADRVLEQEHIIYPLTLKWLAEKRLMVNQETAKFIDEQGQAQACPYILPKP